MKDILTILKETTDCEYRVNTTKTESYELFFVHKKAETVRSSDSTTRSVTLYADHDGYKGDYSFRVSASDSEARIADKIRAAEKQAKLICNQAYSLPAKETLDCDIPSNFSSLPMSELAAQIAAMRWKSSCTARPSPSKTATDSSSANTNTAQW